MDWFADLVSGWWWYNNLTFQLSLLGNCFILTWRISTGHHGQCIPTRCLCSCIHRLQCRLGFLLQYGFWIALYFAAYSYIYIDFRVINKLYVWICICIYVNIYIRICIYVYVYIYIYLCIYIDTCGWWLLSQVIKESLQGIFFRASSAGFGGICTRASTEWQGQCCSIDVCTELVATWPRGWV